MNTDERAATISPRDPSALDAVVRMFTPDCDPDMIPPIRPRSHGLFFGYRELPRLCLSMLREAKGPMWFDHIVDRVILTKGIEPDGHLPRHSTDTTRAALLRIAHRGLVRKVMDQPDAWSELVRREE
jgi:hypothetical protein